MSYTSLEDAKATLARALAPKARREAVGIRDAYGRILAEDVVAREDQPALDASHFDGYAIFSKDTSRATATSPVRLKLRAKVDRVGVRPSARMSSGEASKVLTGGFLPLGTDAVVAVEDARLDAGDVVVSKHVRPGEHVFHAGSDVRKGDRLLLAGKTLVGQDLVLLASLHIEKIMAFKRPRVAILPTGSELTTDIGDRSDGKVVESHSLLFTRLVEEAGGLASTMPIAPDERPSLSAALKRALRASELVFTIAGSSIGEPDLVESVLRGFGKSTTALVHGVKVNRGRVMGCAVVDGKPVVMLPGPIQGALNAFIVFGYPLIRFHLGMGWEQPPSVDATIGADWDPSGKFKDFDQIVYLRLTKDPGSPGGLLAMPSGAETEKVSFLVSKNAYALLSGNDLRLTKGERIEAHLLPGFSRLG